jgi:hypothetical protein
MARSGKMRSLVKWTMFGLGAAAIVQELRKPAKDREWHGTVAGFVPYDFRFPTVDRIKQRWWNPNTDQVLTPQVFGVGWTINWARVRDLVTESR